MSWSATEIQTWLGQCVDRMIAAAPELNELDGKLGDGDLGATIGINMRWKTVAEIDQGKDQHKGGKGFSESNLDDIHALGPATVHVNGFHAVAQRHN